MKFYYKRSYNIVINIFLIILIGNLWSGREALGFFSTETYGKIVGRVTDASTGDVLPSVNVTVLNTTLGSSTNFKGEFFIIGVPVGSYELRVSSIGFAPVKVTNVRVSAGLETTVNIELEPTTLEIPEEIVVTARRYEVGKFATSTVHIIDEDDIFRLYAEDPTGILMTFPGVTDDKIIRGGRPSDIDFQVDGISIRDPLFGGIPHESMINNLALKEIQIKTGGFSAGNGNAMSGIVNLITGVGGMHWNGKIRIKNSFSALNGYNKGAKLNPRGEKIVEFAVGGPLSLYNQNLELFFAGKVNTQRNRTPGLDVLDPKGNNITDYQHNRLARHNIFGKAIYRLNPNMKIVAGGLFGRSNQEEDSWLWRYNDNYNNLPSISQKNSLGYLRFTHTLSNRLFYETTLEYMETLFEQGLKIESRKKMWYSNYDILPAAGQETQVDYGVNNPYGVEDIFVNTGQLNSYWSTKSRYYGLNVNVVTQLKDYLLLRAGAETKLYHVANIYQGNSFEIPNTFQDNYNYKPYTFSGFGLSTIDLSGLHIDAGLRLQYFDPKSTTAFFGTASSTNSYIVNKKFHISPRLGISSELQNGLVVHANFGWLYQLPTFHSLYARQELNVNEPDSKISGNPHLNPQRTAIYETGLTYSFSEIYTLNATAYYKNLNTHELADTLSISSRDVPHYSNGGTGRVVGLELNFIRRPSKNLAMRLSYTISSARGTFSLMKQPRTINEIPETYNDLSNIVAPQSLLESPTIQKTYPLSFDRLHNICAVIDYSAPHGNGPVIFGSRPLQNLSANFTSIIRSGTPYTQRDVYGNIIGEYNFSRNPWNIITNLRLQKFFPNNRFKFSVFLDIRNLFNRVKPLAYYPSNSPLYPGKTLSVPQKGETKDDPGEGFVGVNQYSRTADLNNDKIIDDREKEAAYQRFFRDFIRLKTMYQLPREIWFGFQFHF